MKQKTQRFSTILLSSTFMVLITLALLWSNVYARRTASGAGGCGNFIDAIAQAKDGDTIDQMIPAKDTDSAVITKNLRIVGGWEPTVNCDEANQTFTTTTDFLNYGFLYKAPQVRSELNANSNSVLILEDTNAPGFPNLDKLVLEHLTLNNGSSGGSPIYGGGISGTISGTTEVLLDNLFFESNYARDDGGGVKLELWGDSHLIIEDSLFELNEAQNVNGGGLHIKLHNNAKLTIDNTAFTNNSAIEGGGFAIYTFDNSEVVIRHSQFQENRTHLTGNSAAGGQIIMEGGHVLIENTMFSNNNAGQNGGGLYLDMTGGEVEIINSSFIGNEADNNNDSKGGGLYARMDGGHLVIRGGKFADNTTVGNSTSGQAGGLYAEGVGAVSSKLDLINVAFANNLPTNHQFMGNLQTTILDQSIYLPMIVDNASSTVESAEITSITLDASFNYIVNFKTYNFVPGSTTHVHFFFDTVAAEEAGVPGSGPWKLYRGTSPFTEYTFAQRPDGPYGAEKMCVLVANADHSIRLNTGNCVKLP